MKLKDVIASVGAKQVYLDFDTVWSINNDGNICVDTIKTINVEDEVSIVYDWYHNGIDESIIESILQVIFDHDYETFLEYMKSNFPYPCYFPVGATIYLTKSDCIIGSVLISQSKAAFNLIEWADPHNI